MAVKELFTKHGVENAELMAEVEGLLAAEAKKTEGIPYSRFKEKVDEANNLKADIAERDATIAKKDTELTKIKAEVDRLKAVEVKFTEYKTAEETKTLQAWEEKSKIFTVPDSDPNFEKVEKIRGKFKFPGKDETLTAEQAQHNLEIYTLIEETGYFGDTPQPGGEIPAKGSPPKGKDFNPFKAFPNK